MACCGQGDTPSDGDVPSSILFPQPGEATQGVTTAPVLLLFVVTGMHKSKWWHRHNMQTAPDVLQRLTTEEHRAAPPSKPLGSLREQHAVPFLRGSGKGGRAMC